MTERWNRIKLTYLLTFEAAFHFGTGLRRGLLNRTVRRDAEGFLFVPGSTFKGALRDRCEQLARLFGMNPSSPHDEPRAREEYARPDPLSYLFGSRLCPGELYFDDARMSAQGREFFNPGRGKAFLALQTRERTQVSLSRRTGTAGEGLLFSSEFGIHDQDLHFEGEITGDVAYLPLDAQDDSLPTFPLLLLLAGLHSLDRIGGGKSSGGGHCRLQVTTFQVDGTTPSIPGWLGWLDWLGNWSAETTR
jgi:CRISPR/Cas system CSM-associated protein Csm3 (group 7 of RAMP superfamily)